MLVLPFISAQLGICNGFIFNETCYTIGSEIVTEDVYSYVDINGDLQPQKQDGSECQNNFECLNNLCSFGECVNLYKEIEGRRSIIEGIEGTDPYANDTEGNGVDIGSTSFSISVRVCKSLPCSDDEDIFYKDENIYIDYVASLEDVSVQSNLTYPDGSIKEINLSKSLQASQLGIYELSIKGSKTGYNPVIRKKVFGVVNHPVKIITPNCNLDGSCDSGENNQNCPEDCPPTRADEIIEDIVSDPFWLTVIIIILILAILVVIALILKERVKKHGTRIVPGGPKTQPRPPSRPTGPARFSYFRPRPRPRPRVIPRR